MERYDERLKDFKARNAKVVGVSVDTIEDSRDLVKRLDLHFPLLSDPSAVVVKAYSVHHAEKRIALPSIFVIDKEGTIRWRRVSGSITDRPEEDEVLAILDTLPK